MDYAIRHFTRYSYSRPIWQSLMEVRMHPRSERTQRCFSFQLSVSPRAHIWSYKDHLGNVVHHFDIPAQHQQLTIITDTLVEVEPVPALPDCLKPAAWKELDRCIEAEDFWEMLLPSRFAQPTPMLDDFARELGVANRDEDPLAMMRRINAGVHERLEYARKATRANSPIDDALEARKGVCQDFAHIVIALARRLKIPCRYVSGYVDVARNGAENAAESATHAWADAFLPHLGWIGFDPVRNEVAGEGHIRIGIGPDYADVPPSAGTMKGTAATELQVRVRVAPGRAILPPDEDFAADEEWSHFYEEDAEAQSSHAQQQDQNQ